MRKLLRTNDLLLLGLSNILDIFQETQDPFHIASNSYRAMYGWVPRKFRKNNFNHLVWRTLKAGYIEKVEKGGEVYIRITSQGKEKIQRDFPMLSFQQKGWDRKWRIVTFDIDEVNRQIRERLRGKLKELGFGMLQESVFISPYDIMKDFSEFISYYKLDNDVFILEASKIIIGDIGEFADKIWKLEKLNNKYMQIIKDVENSYLILDSGRLNKLNSKLGKKGKEKINSIRKNYLDIVLSDPFLPKELLPFGWKGEEAKKMIKKLSKVRYE